MTTTIKDVGSGNVVRGFNAGDDWSASAIARDNIISAGSTSTADVKDANVTTGTSSTVDHEFDLVPNVPLNRPQTVTLTNETAGVISISGNSATRVADGTASVLVTTQTMGKRRIMFSVARSGGATSKTWNHWVTGSLAKSIADALDALIAGKTASGTTYNLFSTIDNTNHVYNRNASLFASSVDFSCLAASYNGSQQFGGTLITPRHFITANHNLLNGTGANADGSPATIYFSDTSNNVSSRTVTAGAFLNISGTDIAIVKLSADVPAGIHFAKVLPSNWASYLPSLQYRVPVVFSNQRKELRVYDWTAVAGNANFVPPTNSTRLSFYTVPIVGDSSAPVFVLIGGAPVLLGCWTYPFACPMTADNISAINSALTTLGGGYTLTTVDLLAFPTY